MRSEHNIRLRALEPADVDRLYIWENDPEMWRHGVSTAPYSRHQLWEYVHNYDADPLRSGQLRLIIEVTGPTFDNGNDKSATPIAVGCVDLYDIDPRNRHAYIGIMIAPQWRNRGFASEAVRQMSAYCKESLALNVIAASVAADNAPSIRLFERCGYTRCGTIARWVYSPSGDYSDAAIFQFQL